MGGCDLWQGTGAGVVCALPGLCVARACHARACHTRVLQPVHSTCERAECAGVGRTQRVVPLRGRVGCGGVTRLVMRSWAAAVCLDMTCFFLRHGSVTHASPAALSHIVIPAVARQIGHTWLECCLRPCIGFLDVRGCTVCRKAKTVRCGCCWEADNAQCIVWHQASHLNLGFGWMLVLLDCHEPDLTQKNCAMHVTC